MSYKTYNPYPHLGEQFSNGMDYIIENISSPSSEVPQEITFEQLNTTLMSYLQTVFNHNPENPFAPVLQNIALSILPNAANSYQNSNLSNDSFYSPQQTMLINSIYNSIKANDVEGILAVLENANEDIAQSGLSAVDQAPLFIAVEIAKSSYQYWLKNIYNRESNWRNYINQNAAINVSNLPFWITTSMEGALSGFAQIQQMDMRVASTLNSLGRPVAAMMAMIAAVGLSSGKIFFKWVKRVNTGNLTLSKETIALLNSDPVGQGGADDIEKIWGTRVLCFASKADNCSEGSCGGTRTIQTTKWEGVVIACFNI
jgi:hypothetical protein